MPVFKRASAGGVFNNTQLAHLRSIFEAACADLGIEPADAERADRVARRVMALASEGEMDGETIRRRLAQELRAVKQSG